MIGTKKLSEIKKELREALRPKKAEIEARLDQEIAKLSDKERRDPKVVEELLWIRDVLREIVNGKKPTRKTSGKPKRKRIAGARR
jgi:hypothetical protein